MFLHKLWLENIFHSNDKTVITLKTSYNMEYFPRWDFLYFLYKTWKIYFILYSVSCDKYHLTLKCQWRFISSWKFDLFMNLDTEVGASRPMLLCVTLCPLINSNKCPKTMKVLSVKGLITRRINVFIEVIYLT